MAFTNSDKALCAEREVQQREWVYRRRVADGKMSKAKADRELAIMREIAMEYRDKAIKDAIAADLFSIPAFEANHD
jgi:hypothetical protein